MTRWAYIHLKPIGKIHFSLVYLDLLTGWHSGNCAWIRSIHNEHVNKQSCRINIFMSCASKCSFNYGLLKQLYHSLSNDKFTEILNENMPSFLQIFVRPPFCTSLRLRTGSRRSSLIDVIWEMKTYLFISNFNEIIFLAMKHLHYYGNVWLSAFIVFKISFQIYFPSITRAVAMVLMTTNQEPHFPYI